MIRDRSPNIGNTTKRSGRRLRRPLKETGISGLEIYLTGNPLFMILEAGPGFSGSSLTTLIDSSCTVGNTSINPAGAKIEGGKGSVARHPP
jgi:hypothetical protein